MQKNSPLHVLVIPHGTQTVRINDRRLPQAVLHGTCGIRRKNQHALCRPTGAVLTAEVPYDAEALRRIEHRLCDILPPYAGYLQIQRRCTAQRLLRTVEKLYKAYVKQHGKPDILHNMSPCPPDTPLQSSAKNIIFRSSSRSTPHILSVSLRGSTAKYGLYAARHSVMTCVSGYMTDILKKKNTIYLPKFCRTSSTPRHFCGAKKPKRPAHFRLTTVSALRPANAWKTLCRP